MDLPVVEGDLSADDRSTDNATKINSNQLNSLIDDDIYCLLKQHFLRAPGRGRPVALPQSICLTHRLLIQLYFLKEEDEQNTFFDLQQWLCKIVPTTGSVSRSRITHHVMAVYKQCLEMTHREAMTFLDRSFDFHALPSPLTSFGLNRLSLLDMDSFTLLPSSDNKAIVVTNDVIRCLEHFQVQENLPLSFVVKWVRKLSPACQMNDNQVRLKVMSVCKKIRTFVKSKKSKELAEFLTMPFVTRSNPVPSTTNPRDAICAENRAYKDLKKVNEKLELTIGKQKLNISVLTEECESLRQKKESLNQVEVQLKDTVKENRSLKSQLKEKEEKLDNVTQTRTYKHNTFLRKKLQEASQNLESLNTRNEELGEEVCAAKHKLSLAQTAKSNFKKKFEKEKERCKALTEVFQAKDEPDNSSKCESKNKFKDPVRLAYMELQGKAEVAASKCSKVVQIVGKHIFGHNFSMEELPSSSSALNFADEAHHISLHQVVDKINNSDHYTFASDGTSRQKKQFLERHIILSDKTQLSIGFTEIASNDAKTLLEQTLELLQEITEIFCIDDESKKDAVF